MMKKQRILLKFHHWILNIDEYREPDLIKSESILLILVDSIHSYDIQYNIDHREGTNGWVFESCICFKIRNKS